MACCPMNLAQNEVRQRRIAQCKQYCVHYNGHFQFWILRISLQSSAENLNRKLRLIMDLNSIAQLRSAEFQKSSKPSEKIKKLPRELILNLREFEPRVINELWTHRIYWNPVTGRTKKSQRLKWKNHKF